MNRVAYIVDKDARVVNHFVLTILIGIERAGAKSLVGRGALSDLCGLGASPHVHVANRSGVFEFVEVRVYFHTGVVAALAVVVVPDCRILCVDKWQEEERQVGPHFVRVLVEKMEV